MWMVLGLSACSPTKTEIGNLNVIPQPQEVSQDIQAHPFVINPQTGIVYPEGNEKLQRTAEFFAPLDDAKTPYRELCEKLKTLNDEDLKKVSTFISWIEKKE